MSEAAFTRPHGRRITNIQVEGVTSAEPAKIFYVPRDSGVTIYPTSAGTAQVYMTTSPVEDAKADDTNAAITGSTTATWVISDAGAVAALSQEVTTAPLVCVALVVTSGTWTIEISTEL